MTSWRDYFTGCSLDESVHEKVKDTWPIQWWKSRNKRTKPLPQLYLKPHVAYKVVHGSVCQTDMWCSRFAGSQCTSICLEAICYWINIAKCGYLDPTDLDKINDSGHHTHVHLRVDRKVSDDEDLRVGIEDLPDSCKVKTGMFYNRRYWEQYVGFSRDVNDKGCLKISLRDYLLSCQGPGEPFGVLVTIGHYTQAIMFNKDHKWLVFDSHGSVDFLGQKANKSSVWQFHTLDAVLAFLLKVRGDKGYCLVARPAVVHQDLFAKPQSKSSPWSLSRLAQKCTRKVVEGFKKVQRAMSVPMQFDDDPYVTLMGGGLLG